MLLASFSLQAAETSKISDIIADVQKRVANQSKNYPILILDRDQLEWRFAQAKTSLIKNSDDRSKQQALIIQKYVEEKTNIQLSENDATSLEVYVSAKHRPALSMPVVEENSYKFCAVIPAGFNSNQRLSTERIMDLLVEEAYQDLKYENLALKMSYEEILKFSLYHEVGHCLDPEFLPQVVLGNIEADAHDVHLSESFAEVLAVVFSW